VTEPTLQSKLDVLAAQEEQIRREARCVLLREKLGREPTPQEVENSGVGTAAKVALAVVAVGAVGIAAYAGGLFDWIAGASKNGESADETKRAERQRAKEELAAKKKDGPPPQLPPGPATTSKGREYVFKDIGPGAISKLRQVAGVADRVTSIAELEAANPGLDLAHLKNGLAVKIPDAWPDLPNIYRAPGAVVGAVLPGSARGPLAGMLGTIGGAAGHLLGADRPVGIATAIPDDPDWTDEAAAAAGELGASPPLPALTAAGAGAAAGGASGARPGHGAAHPGHSGHAKPGAHSGRPTRPARSAAPSGPGVEDYDAFSAIAPAAVAAGKSAAATLLGLDPALSGAPQTDTDEAGA
jgi:hypothetical protein